MENEVRLLQESLWFLVILGISIVLLMRMPL
nr:MAG TPA: hypothetical protein [Caudoviricetes sp.]